MTICEWGKESKIGISNATEQPILISHIGIACSFNGRKILNIGFILKRCLYESFETFLLEGFQAIPTTFTLH